MFEDVEKERSPESQFDSLDDSFQWAKSEPSPFSSNPAMFEKEEVIAISYLFCYRYLTSRNPFFIGTRNDNQPYLEMWNGFQISFLLGIDLIQCLGTFIDRIFSSLLTLGLGTCSFYLYDKNEYAAL